MEQISKRVRCISLSQITCKKYLSTLQIQVVNSTINFIHFQVRLTKEDRYFNDPFEALPKYGYTNFFEKLLLNNAEIDVRLNMDYFEVNIIYQYG